MKTAGKQLKHKEPGLFHPVIDRTRCEGGHHHECKGKNSPCISACPFLSSLPSFLISSTELGQAEPSRKASFAFMRSWSLDDASD